MNNDEEFRNFNSIISSTFKNIQLYQVEKADSVLNVWKKILLSIKSYTNPNEGQNLADHSKVVDLKNGILLIEVDHPGWIELLQLHKKYIMIGLKRNLPDINIKTLAFRLKGKKDDLFAGYETKSTPEKVRTKIEERLENDEKILQNSGAFATKGEKSRENKELPQELACIFDDLKQSMLTNSQK